MKITDHIRNAKSTFFSFEIIPPKKGDSIQSLFSSIDPLMEFNPPFIDVTYHREEFIYKKLGNGTFEKQSVRKRPGTVGICAAIQNRYKVDAVPHIICGGFTKEDTENALIDLNFLGIDNVLALRGDNIKSESTFFPEKNGNAFATHLVEQIANMNKGIYLDEELESAIPTDFCIGVAGYPEKHFEAPNINFDLKWLKKKVELGAEYVITQMFFDNSKYFEFKKKCVEEGINIPIIPGIKPIASSKHLTILPSIFHIDLPEDLEKEILKCQKNEDVKKVGIEWSRHQCQQLIEKGVPAIHFYCMGKSESIQQIAQDFF